MNKVKAALLPFSSNWSFPRGADVVRVEYALGALKILLRGPENAVVVDFENTIGFRVLDERDMMEYWPVCSTPNGWLFEIDTGGWLSQERERHGSCIGAMYPEAKEYLVTGEDDCVSVLSTQAPKVREHAL